MTPAARPLRRAAPATALLIPVALFAVAALPPLGPRLQASLPLHVLVQFPLLVTAGAALGHALARRRGPRDAAEAIAALLLAIGCLAFWMLPRWLDAAVLDARVDALKAASLALLCGLPVGWCWGGLPAVARGVLWANAVSMAFVMGWLYLNAPERLCTTYLLDEQALLGEGMLLLAAGLALFGVIHALRGPSAARHGAQPGSS